MSQKKVEAYKKEKRNRKKNLIREKRMRVLGRLAAVICICLFVGALYYIAKNPTDSQAGGDAAQTDQTDMEALQQQLMEQLNASGAAVSSDGSIMIDGSSSDTDDATGIDNGDGGDNASDADSSDGEGSSSDADNADGNGDASDSDGE